MEKPQLAQMPSKTPAFEKLETACKEYMDFVSEGNSHYAHKAENYVFEAAIELLYGPDVWEYVNSKLV